MFAVAWQGWDGAVLPGPPADLTIGWEGDFVLEGSVNMGPRGTARCVYEPGNPVLDCVYENPGHGGKMPGLILPGSPQAEYTVTVADVPAGWKVDTTTIGTFVGRDTCPRGHDDGHDGGHEGETPTIAAEEGGGGEGGNSCTHTVVLIQDPPSGHAPRTPGTRRARSGCARRRGRRRCRPTRRSRSPVHRLTVTSPFDGHGRMPTQGG